MLGHRRPGGLEIDQRRPGRIREQHRVMAQNVNLSRNASAVAKKIVESLRIENISRASVPRPQPISDVFMSLDKTQPVKHRARGHPLIELTQRWALQAQSKFRLPNQDELQILSDPLAIVRQ